MKTAEFTKAIDEVLGMDVEDATFAKCEAWQTGNETGEYATQGAYRLGEAAIPKKALADQNAPLVAAALWAEGYLGKRQVENVEVLFIHDDCGVCVCLTYERHGFINVDAPGEQKA